MNIRNSSFNFQIITNLVESARHMQDAGSEEKAGEILKLLAKNILKQSDNIKNTEKIK